MHDTSNTATETTTKLSMMRWGFKLPDRLLFNVRSEGVTSAKFSKEKFAEHRCIAYSRLRFAGTTTPRPDRRPAVFVSELTTVSDD
jgi:hypothetical protein